MGWIADLLALPLSMHRRLHMIRMATPPAEDPETFIIADDRRPGELLRKAEDKKMT